MMLGSVEVGGENEMEFFYPTLPFLTKVHRRRTNCVTFPM